MTQITPIPDAVPTFEPAPAGLRGVAMVLGGASVLAGVAAAIFAAINQPAPLWAVVGMQALVVVGGVFAVLWSRARFAAGPALAILCAAGSIGVGAFLSYVANRGALGPLSMKVWAGSELLSATILTFVAFWTAVSRDPASRAPAIRAVLLAIPAVVGVLVVVAGSRFGIDRALASLPGVARVVLMLAYGLVASIMACMSAHALATSLGRAAAAGRTSTAE